MKSMNCKTLERPFDALFAAVSSVPRRSDAMLCCCTENAPEADEMKIAQVLPSDRAPDPEALLSDLTLT